MRSSRSPATASSRGPEPWVPAVPSLPAETRRECKPGAERISLRGLRPVPTETKESLAIRSRSMNVLPALLAVLAVSAIASASASAANCGTDTLKEDYAVCVESPTGSGKTIEYENKELENENHAVKATFESEIGGFEVELNSTEAIAKLTAENSGVGKGTIKFKNVTVAKPAKCTVKAVGGTTGEIEAIFTSL